MKTLNKSNHVMTIILCGFKSHNPEILTNLWETGNMNNAIFFLTILAYVCLSVARFYSRNFPGDRYNFYNFLFPNLQRPNSENTPYL